MGVSKVIFGSEILIDLTSDTVTADKLAKGVTAHDKSGELITGSNENDANTQDADVTAAEVLAPKTFYARGVKGTGTMVNNGAKKIYIEDASKDYPIPIGFHDGSGIASIATDEKAKLIPGNIKSGVEILGVTGSYGGEPDKVQSKTVTPKLTQQTIIPDEGYDYLSQVVVAAIPRVNSENSAGGTTVTIG